MIEFHRKNSGFVVLNSSRGEQFELSRAEAKALARFLMIELNIVAATVREGDFLKPMSDQIFEELVKKRWNP